MSDLNTKFIKTPLINFGLITNEDEELVIPSPTNSLANDKEEAAKCILHLLDILTDNPNNALDKFIQVLREDDIYPWIAERLELEFETEKRVHQESNACRARRASSISTPESLLLSFQSDGDCELLPLTTDATVDSVVGYLENHQDCPVNKKSAE